MMLPIGESMTEWISVVEKLPDKNQYERKLVFSTCEGVCTAKYKGSYWELDPQGDFSTGGFIPEITHWAELPEPPDD